jgi:surfeit locus 1 family protein
MRFKIKNWKLTLLALAFICLFFTLGVWQWSRATEKQILSATLTQRTQHPPLSASDLNPSRDQRFYTVKLKGRFDNDHSFLLDNKISKGKVGYEIYTPFLAEGVPSPILVDRGFIPITQDRLSLPAIHAIPQPTMMIGMINLPPRYVSFGNIHESTTMRYPLRIEYINLNELSTLLGFTLSPFLLIIDPTHPGAYDVSWQIATMPPEKHQAYAIQWFALALTLLILSVALNKH